VALIISMAGIVGCSAPEASTPDFSADIVVYGGTSAGVIAAYSAKMYDNSVLLVTPGRHLGGLSSGGLGRTDSGDKGTVTGLSRLFYRRLGDYYGQEEAWNFEPRAAEQVFEQFVDEADVEVLYSRRVTDVEKQGTNLQQITVEYAGDGAGTNDLVVAGELFIDTSYEGDLMGRAGISYTVGRESNEKYDEIHNGVQMNHPDQYHQFPDGIDPFVVEGDSSSGLLEEITGWGLAENGTGDDKVQAYNFRLCLCQGEEMSRPIPRPENYDPDRYELLARTMEVDPWENKDDGFLIGYMPDGKTDWNNYGPFSTDYIGKNWDYPEASYEEREKMWQEHKAYQQGLMYFLAHDEQVPEHIRTEMQSWGYCRDEFLDTGGWPHALYVREARRMIGVHVMNDNNIVGENRVEDGIAFGSYNMDSHNVQRVVIEDPEGGYMVKNEGDVEKSPGAPYPISYRSVLPKSEEASNLLVPVALSASHIAFGSIRMEPVFMMLGQAVGVAGAMALEQQVSVQAVDAVAIQRELRENPLAGGAEAEKDLQVFRFDPGLK
jgi:hypothetical protein